MYYTYLIGWTHLQKFYYGVRFSDSAHVTDLWKVYFTSSKHVKRFRADNGEPDVIQIRRVFKTKQAAIDWESKVLRRLKVRENTRWLNIAAISAHWNRSVGSPSNKGKPMSAEQRQKISSTRKEKKLGHAASKNLPKLTGDRNPMRDPTILDAYKKKISGRRMILIDGKRKWSYDQKDAGDSVTKLTGGL